MDEHAMDQLAFRQNGDVQAESALRISSIA